MSELGVVLVGGERTHQEFYAGWFAGDGRCNITALTDEADISPERHALNRCLANRLNVPYVPLTEALQMPAPIASVCIEMERRGRVASSLATAGKHLYLDKPLAASVDDARLIATAVKDADVIAQVASHVHTNWARQARWVLNTESLGKTLQLQADMLVAKGTQADLVAHVRHESPVVRHFPSATAKREMFDMGFYPVSLLCWMTGERIVEISALTGNYFFQQHLEQDTEDFGALLLRFESGMVATVTCGRIGWESHPAKGIVRVAIAGERGFADFNDMHANLQVWSRTPPFVPPPQDSPDPMGMWASTLAALPVRKTACEPLAPDLPHVDVSRFIDCVVTRSQPEVTAQDGVHHLQVLMAAYRSAATRQPVCIEPE
jgi:predicted dehydrogenase